MKFASVILLAVSCLTAGASIKLPRAFIFVTQSAHAFNVGAASAETRNI